MGTPLTDAQVDALKRLAPRVLLCQDPDTAGQEAVAKGTHAIRAFNAARAGDRRGVRVVRLPAGRAPAEVVLHDGAAAVRRLLEGAVPLPRVDVDRAPEEAELCAHIGRA